MKFDVDAHNTLHGAIHYAARDGKVLIFSSSEVRHFTFSDKELRVDAAGPKRAETLVVHLEKGSPSNLLVWTSGKERFEAHPTIDDCKVQTYNPR